MGRYGGYFEDAARKAVQNQMTRIVLLDLILFLLPFIVFGGWRWLVHGARGRHELMSDAPIFVLLVLGIIFGSAGLYFLASHDKTGIEGRYHPPVIKDGKIQPGHFEKSGLLDPSRAIR